MAKGWLAEVLKTDSVAIKWAIGKKESNGFWGRACPRQGSRLVFGGYCYLKSERWILSDTRLFFFFALKLQDIESLYIQHNKKTNLL